MIRRYNYTNRTKLPRKDIRITVGDDGRFSAEISLQAHDLPSTAAVYLDAYSSGSASILRFPYGTVGSPDPTASDRQLGDLAQQGVIFDLKVVDQTDSVGRLLGVSTGIQPVDGDGKIGQQSILPVNQRDLDEQVWRLEFNTPNGVPWLEVNNRIPDIMTVVREDPRFFALVYPAVIRQVLTKILVVDDYQDPDGDDDDWRSHWLRWGIHWHPDGGRPAEGPVKDFIEEWLQWVDDVVESFCSKHKVRERYEAVNEEAAT